MKPTPKHKVTKATRDGKPRAKDAPMALIPAHFDSVEAMLRATLDPADASRTIAYLDARKLVSSLVVLRVGQGVTQVEMAARLGCSQAKVSKLERAKDLDLSIRDVVAFAQAFGNGVRLAVEDGDGLAIEVESKPEATGRKRVRN
jgi:predicted XRE-type DNA-binding protein